MRVPLHNKQLRQLRTCGHVARTVCTVRFRVSPAMTGTFFPPPPFSTPTHTHDCHNKCKVLPSVGVCRRERVRQPYMHRLLPATCHLAPSTFFLACFLASFFCSFFYNFYTSSATIFSFAHFTAMCWRRRRGRCSRLPTHVEKFSLRFCDMKML